MIDLCPLVPAPVIILKKSCVGHIHITLIFVFCMFRSRPSSLLQPTICAMPSTTATSPTTASGAWLSLTSTTCATSRLLTSRPTTVCLALWSLCPLVSGEKLHWWEKWNCIYISGYKCLCLTREWLWSVHALSDGSDVDWMITFQSNSCDCFELNLLHVSVIDTDLNLPAF